MYCLFFWSDPLFKSNVLNWGPSEVITTCRILYRSIFDFCLEISNICFFRFNQSTWWLRDRYVDNHLQVLYVGFFKERKEKFLPFRSMKIFVLKINFLSKVYFFNRRSSKPTACYLSGLDSEMRFSKCWYITLQW